MKQRLVGAGGLFFLLIVALVCIGQCLGLGLSRDEHQFVAPAWLWAHEGKIPYRDVPIFHQPYLIAIDALAMKLIPAPLFAARLISGIASLLTAFLLFICAWRAIAEKNHALRLALSAAITTLWLTSHLYDVSSGRAWNHDVSTLFALGGLTLLLFCEQPGIWRWLAAGILAGLSAGSRLTFLPFAGLLPFAALFWPGLTKKNRLLHCGAAAAGVAVALAPSVGFYLQSPDAYLFGNFQFPRLPLLDADNSRILKTITPWRKLRFFFKEVVLSNLPLLLPFLGLALLRLRISIPRRWPLAFPLLGLLAGAFAPSRYEMQHFYVVAPLAALLGARLLSGARRPAVLLVLTSAVAGLVLGGSIFERAWQVFHPSDWDVARIHQDGLDLRARVASGKVLTLRSIVALEGGLSIYPGLATGRFGWQFAHLVPQPRRAQLGLYAPDDLAALFATDPPGAILTDLKPDKLEKPLAVAARKAGFKPQNITDKMTLWLKP